MDWVLVAVKSEGLSSFLSPLSQIRNGSKAHNVYMWVVIKLVLTPPLLTQESPKSFVSGYPKESCAKALEGSHV